MAKITPVNPVKLFFGVLYNTSFDMEQVKRDLESLYGKIDYTSPVFPFDFTDYYRKEMGDDIKRLFYSFEDLVSPDILADIKVKSNEIEDLYSLGEKRSVNLDPGYLDYYKIVLASMKFGGQKVYLSKGTYADITLWYEKGNFKTFPWTFLDFKSGLYDNIFLHIRNLYKKQRKHL